MLSAVAVQMAQSSFCGRRFIVGRLVAVLAEVDCLHCLQSIVVCFTLPWLQ